MRNWMTETHIDNGNIRWVRIDMDDYYPVSIYKDTTGQYTDEEIDDPKNSEGNCVEIPVPKDLLMQWFRETWNIDRDYERMNKEFGYTEDDVISDLRTWIYEESTCDDTAELYGWLVAHNYNWKRLN